MLYKIKKRLRKEYIENRKLFVETMIFVVLSLVAMALTRTFDLTEEFFEYTRKHEEYNLDEIVFSLSIISLLMLIFVARRFYELRSYVIKANTDALIGIYNRRKGTEIIYEEMHVAKKKNQKISLIIYDLDNFKKINDELGHNTGDTVLKSVVAVVDSNIREDDAHIRWGGEEFLILCPNTDLEKSAKIAERCRACIQAEMILSGRKITASFGVIEMDTEKDLRGNIELLDAKLYRCKADGKNGVCA